MDRTDQIVSLGMILALLTIIVGLLILPLYARQEVTLTVSPEIVLVDTVAVPLPPQEWLPAFGLECRWVPAEDQRP